MRVLGPLPRREALRCLIESDVFLQLGHNFIVQVPGKLYEYPRCGRPILALVPAGAQTDLLHATGGAWIVEPDDVNDVVGAVRDAYRRSRKGESGPEADARLVSSFDRRVLVGRIANELKAAVARGAERGRSCRCL